VTAGLALLPPGDRGRQSRDRLEVLTALIGGPGFDPLLRSDIIQIPLNHPVFRWNCMVHGCERPTGVSVTQAGTDLCFQHQRTWKELAARGQDQLEFLRTATPLTSSIGIAPKPCRVSGCGRPARPYPARLCVRHLNRWKTQHGGMQTADDADFDAWAAGEQPYQSYGGCRAACCDDLAKSPLGLCEYHEARYGKDGRPGQAVLPGNWVQSCQERGLEVPVRYAYEAAFRLWCSQVLPPLRVGQINLKGMHPLVKAELQWGLFAHTQHQEHTRWSLRTLQPLAAACRAVSSLDELDPGSLTRHGQQAVRQMRNDLRIIYFTPSGTREAGYIEPAHFGKKISRLTGRFDLTKVTQRWLRDMLWDFLAEQMRSPDCPRSHTPYSTMRRACQELSAFLDARAPGGGHDPRMIEEEHVRQFVADQYRRAREGLSTLGITHQGKPSVATEVTRKLTLDRLRQLMRWALENGDGDRAGVNRAVIRAFPGGGKPQHRTRSPFPDEVARAMADEANLRRLAELDLTDRGLRDAWETIVVTGRRASEVLQLRLECIARHNGIPMLWHDQTKVGNYDQAIRIPEYAYQRLQERQHKTLATFERRFGRAPTSQERTRLALFPARHGNPRGERAVSYAWFGKGFRAWVAGLDLGHYVAHQARHTLATRLLAAGAGLHHIKRYLGQVSERMAEHYAKVALGEIDDILHHVWVAGPGAPSPGELLSSGITPLTREEAQALVLDLNRRSTPAEGGLCTFQAVVDGGACPWKLDCHNCDRFVMTGADLLYWRRKREQWSSLAERAPDDATADYLHQVFEPTARAIDGLEKALAGLGLLDEALALDLRRPQDYFHRVWSLGFNSSDLASAGSRDRQEIP